MKFSMFDSILVALDGSEVAESVLPYLQDLAPRFDSELHIFGVCIEPERGLARLIKIYLERIASDLQEQKIKAKAVLFHGSPPDEILEYAEKNKIGLIAMTTHGRGGFTRWLLGSTAEKVIQETTSPVLLVRSRRPSEAEVLERVAFSRILVPLDGSRIGEAALPCVKALASKIKSSVTLLHIGSPIYEALHELQQEYKGPLPAEMVEDIMAASGSYLVGVGQAMGKKGFEVDWEVLTGDPAEKILEYASERNFDLIAMSSHGRGGIARWVLGSVADKVIRNSEAPVLIVRSPGVTRDKP